MCAKDPVKYCCIAANDPEGGQRRKEERLKKKAQEKNPEEDRGMREAPGSSPESVVVSVSVRERGRERTMWRVVVVNLAISQGSMGLAEVARMQMCARCHVG